MTKVNKYSTALGGIVTSWHCLRVLLDWKKSLDPHDISIYPSASGASRDWYEYVRVVDLVTLYGI